MDFITETLIKYLPNVLGAILTLVIGFWLSNILTSKIKSIMIKRQLDETLIPFLSALISIVLKVLILLSAASMFGIEVTSFVAFFSAILLAIGLALQGNLSHMASGIMILIFKPFKVGDTIATNGYRGKVKEIHLFSTTLTTFDNVNVIIPNGQVMGNALENFTSNDMRKVALTFGISYSADIDKARQVIQEVIDSCELIDHSQETDIMVNSLGDSSVNFVVRPWTKTENYWAVYFYMQEQIKKSFDKAGIGIPFPQMDVHVKKLD